MIVFICCLPLPLLVINNGTLKISVKITVKMRLARIALLYALIFLRNLSVIGQYNYGYNDEGPEFDICHWYDDDHAENGNCFHDSFLNDTIDDGMKCCDGHKYIFYDQCDTRENGGKLMCGDPSLPKADPVQLSHTLKCPQGCYPKLLNQDNFRISNDGLIQWTLTKGHKKDYVNDFCLSYSCSETNQNWEILAHACVCPNSTVIDEEDSQMDADLTRCCPKTLQIHYDDYGWISCPLNEGFTARQKIGGCEKPNFWEDIAWNKTRRINTSMEVSYGITGKTKRTVNLSEERYCVGTLAKHGGLEKTFMYCHIPCGGKKPCLKTCCRPGWLNLDGTCEEAPMGKAGMIVTFLGSQKPLLSQFPNLTEANFDYAPPQSRADCPEGFTRHRTLDPLKRCNDDFSFKWGDDEVLRVDSFQLEKPQENYCIDFHQGWLKS